MFSGPKAEKNVNTQSSCRELVLAQLPNGLFNQTPGWLLISSNPISNPFQQGPERERTAVTIQSFGGHHHLPYLWGLLATMVWALVVYIFISWKKRSKVSFPTQRSPLKPNWLSQPQVSTNNQFHKRTKGFGKEVNRERGWGNLQFLFGWGLSMGPHSLSQR